MSGLGKNKPKGILLEGWYATVDDYAICGAWNPNGTILVVGDSIGGIYGFEGKSGTVLWEQKRTHRDGLLCMAMHPHENILATGGQDGTFMLWNAQKGELLQEINLGRGWVDTLLWSSDGQLLAVSIARRVHMYRKDGSEIWKSADHPSTVSAIQWSKDNEIATACYGQVAFCDASSGEIHETFEWKGSLVSMSVSPDGDIVACGSQDKSVHFWRRSTGEDSMMAGYHGKPSALSFDESGRFLATGGGNSVTVWNFQGEGPEGTKPGTLEIHIQPITKLSFAHQGVHLASGARDGAVIVWSLDDSGNGDIIGASLVEEIISDLLWRPDDRALAALDAHGGVTVWQVGN
ncbi:MAG: hypothetical protein CL916_10520 [Deltaproteobacteria bacterium]|nr:hypothetical protein [Deltaproteobacteria bacterium]